MIHENKKSVFIHIPKVGGMSVNSVLNKLGFRKYTLNVDYAHHAKNCDRGRYKQIQSEYNDDLSNYFKFTFIRNPWDRFVSIYHYLLNTTFCFKDKIDINEFARTIFLTKNNHCKWHCLPQYFHLLDEYNNLNIDFIGRFENLQQDFNFVCDKIRTPQQQLPHENATNHKHYTEYYDDETKQIVSEKYAKDIEYFGYEFGE